MADRQLRQQKKIVVVGAGMIGLSTAVCVQQCCPDVQIEIVAEKFSPHTTSDGSGGYWEPYSMGNTNIEIIKKVSKQTYEFLTNLSLSPLAGEIGVQQLSGYGLVADEVEKDEMFAPWVNGYRRLTPEELAIFPAEHCAKSGYFYTSVQVEVTPYMQWLMKRFIARGGKTTCKKLTSLDQVSSDCDLIINCCGIGAYDLLQDNKIVPVRGQIWRVKAPWIKHFYVFKPKTGAYSYIVPGINSVVVGGTAQVGDWRTDANDEDATDIWHRARKLLPAISEAVPIKSWAGLRPTRSELRMERENMELGGRNVKVIHNYGHGGSGITIHWGCAVHVAGWVMEELGRPHDNVLDLLKSRL